MTRRCLLSSLTPSNTATRRPSWFIVAPWSCVFWGRTRLQVVPLPPLRVAGAEARGSKCSAANSIKQGKNLSPRGRDPSPHGLLCLQKEPNRNAVWRMDSEPFICLPSQPFFGIRIHSQRPPGKGEILISPQVHTGSYRDLDKSKTKKIWQLG